ncbi:CapA family protein [Vitreoscilla massiliensis]|uniref:CapA family protein n=1 Tax=Vitreoscilla massiliensis TaxID=1689272 RepID=A0ABY4DZR2_9NEIS|nr:CapA family protein [Vitreoscilla massiliensis]UOO88020.1 CapA family protein [Vitreoscilla massiliensis]
MGTVDAQAVNLYALLGVPENADGARLRHVIGLHHTAKLLPEAILAKAERYLLSDTLRLQYNLYLKNLTAQHAALSHLNLYAHLNLPHTATAAQIQAALNAHVHRIPLQTWLLARKWLLHPRLRERYDGMWAQRFGGQWEAVLADADVAGVATDIATVETDKASTPWALLAAAALSTAIGVITLERVYQRPIQLYRQQTALPPLLLAAPAASAWSQITITAVGDTTLGSHLGDVSAGTLPAVWREQGDAYFMQEMADVLAHDDLSIANLEGPLTQANGGMDKPFVFKGAPALVGVLRAGSIEAVNVANNHSHDYGAQGHADTLQALQAAQIPAFGYQQYQIIDIKGKRIALAGAKAWSVAQGKEAVEQALAHFKGQDVDYLIMSFHWGQERQYRQNTTQRAIAHYAIDRGINAVLGHHPHVVQGLERYKQGVIVYSLANFVFGGNGNPSDKDSVAVQLRLDFAGKQLLAQDVLALPLSVSGRSNGNDYRPVWANAATQARIHAKMQAASNVDVRMGWREDLTSQALLAHTFKAPAPSRWCDDSGSVWAPSVVDTSLQRFPSCVATRQHWG